MATKSQPSRPTLATHLSAIQVHSVELAALVCSAKVPDAGAVVVFAGVVRDGVIELMELETNESAVHALMTEIGWRGMARFSLFSVAIAHRTRALDVGGDILIVVASGDHRV
jgi:molybdopterin synthase catalytic subunit